MNFVKVKMVGVFHLQNAGNSEAPGGDKLVNFSFIVHREYPVQ